LEGAFSVYDLLSAVTDDNVDSWIVAVPEEHPKESAVRQAGFFAADPDDGRYATGFGCVCPLVRCGSTPDLGFAPTS
jgi:hypothetical protein